MPSDRELAEFMAAHPSVRVWNTRLGQTPVVPFYDVVDALKDAYRRGYNAHAAAAQHWQDTHGAYQQHGEGTNP